jgi:hypothetical protein
MSKAMDRCTTILMVIIFSLFTGVKAQSQVVDKIDWPTFMAQHDLIWEETPVQWGEAAFVGNGQVGMTIYADMKDNRLDFHMGRHDVTDHRKAPDKKTSMGVKGSDLNDYSRLDIGRMVLRPAGKILSISLRQDLWNAEVRGVINTDLGEIAFRAFTPYNRMVNVIEVTSTETKKYRALNYTWEWKAGNPMSPRLMARPDKKEIDAYELNPKPFLKKINGLDVCEQALLAGGDYATAWREEKGRGRTSTMYLAIANEVPATGVSAKMAVKTVKDAASCKMETLEKEHREWWHNYFQKSFLSIPDGRMESFFWIQMYKMAACSRADGPALDLMGPFFKETVWPSLWWNLNVQLTYWPFNASNHDDLSESFITLMDDNFDYMLRSKSGESLGDFAWAMHNYWLIYSYRGDDQALQEKWLPKAMQVAEVYETKLIRNNEGIIELSPMGSPEYRGFKAFKNTNYNLALVRWLFSTLIETSEMANRNHDEVQQWKKTLNELISYPVDENGLMIGSDQAVGMSHRHYSHLLALYPLFQLDPNSEEDGALIDKSVVHWHQIEEGKGLVGYSYTGAASLYAALGRGNDAHESLQHFLTKQIGRGGAVLLPNTFYMEGKNPVIETPLSGAASIMEFLLQSWGKKIRVFPATPDTWEEASFHQLRAEGAFLVSASRGEGKTQWVTIKSLAGKPCTLRVPEWSTATQVSKGQKFDITKIAEGEFEINLKKGDEVTLAASPTVGEMIIRPVSHKASDRNVYGVKKGQSMKRNREYNFPAYEY